MTTSKRSPKHSRQAVKFDSCEFFAAVKDVADDFHMSMTDVSNATGVSQSTLTRLRKGQAPSIDTATALARWGNINLNNFAMPAQGWGFDNHA